MCASDIERFVGRYSIGRDSNPLDVTGSQHFLRVKVPGGLITSDQLRRIAELSAAYGRGLAEITDRQDIQLHWVRAEDALGLFAAMDEIGFTTDMCGQGFGGARYGDPRNIVCCPASGIEKGEILNGFPLVKELTDFFVGNADFLDLPRKFKISISGCGSDCTRAETDDLAFVAVKKGEERGFAMLVGGSVGASLPGPRLAKPVGIFVRPQEAFDAAVATVEIHRDFGNRESKAKARFKWLIESWGVEKFAAVLEEKTGKTFERYDGPIFLRHGDHEGIQPQSQEPYYYVNIPLPGGRLTGSEMIMIADLAEEYGSGELRLTPTQHIIMANVEEKDALLKQLEEMEFSFTASNLRWNSLACASDFCGKTQNPHAKKVLKDIVDHLEKRFDRRLLDEAAFRIYVSGCPNSCCASMIAEIGLTGKLVKEGSDARQTYDIFIGGGFGLDPGFGRLAEERVPAGKLGYKIASLLDNYLKRRTSSESLRGFCNRVTVEELKAYLTTAGG